MDDVWAAVDAHAATGRMADNVRRTRGEAGQVWLAGVAVTARTLAEDWHFTPERVHPDSYRSLLLQGHLADGSPAALKIEPVTTAQSAAVATFAEAGHGPQVWATRPAVNASLLQWVPGIPLPPTPAAMATAATAVVTVHDHTRLAAHPPVPATLLFAAWMTQTVELARRRLTEAAMLGTLYDDTLLDADLAHAAHLPAATQGLCHGDLVPPNALLRPNGTVAFIDPDPHYGPPEVDLAWLALRLNTGKQITDYLAAAHTAHPTLDASLLDWLAAHTARTYVAYKVAMGHTIAPGHLARATTPGINR